MTHKTIPALKRRAAGVQESLIRLSIGLEEPEDLIDDLTQTFNLLEQEKDNPSLHHVNIAL
jgi:cystathionine beta-lyase